MAVQGADLLELGVTFQVAWSILSWPHSLRVTRELNLPEFWPTYHSSSAAIDCGSPLQGQFTFELIKIKYN